MKFQSLLIFLPIGLSTAIAHPAPARSTSTVVPCNIRCRSGFHLFTSPSTGKCSCVPDSTKEICLTATTCVVGSQPVWSEKDSTCTCVPNKPADQCLDIVCIAEQRPVYNAETKTCHCEWIPGLEPGNPTTVREVPAASIDCGSTVCISEKHGVFNPTTNQCQCEWIPGLEPGKPVDTREAETAAVKSCSGIFCISEQHPVWNPTLDRCECKWIPGLEPGVPTVSARDEDPVITKPRPTPIGPIKGGCQGIFCIATHTPWFNATSGQCECIPIDVKAVEKRQAGITPTPVTSVIATPKPSDHCTMLKAWCQCSPDHYMHFDPILGGCACPRCPKTTFTTFTAPPEPTVNLKCEDLKIFCEGGDHKMHENPVTKQCECPPVESRDVESLKCEDLKIFCEGGDHKMHENPVTKQCECPAVES